MDRILNLTDKVFYQWGYIMFSINLALAPTVEIDNQVYVAKKELHVSLLCIKDYVPKLARKLGKSEEEANNFLLNKACFAFKIYPLAFDSFYDVFLKVEKEDKKTLAVRVRMSGLEEILGFISKETGIPVEVPPTHITLYTLENGLSIGLNNYEDLVAYSKELDKKSRDVIKKAIKSWS